MSPINDEDRVFEALLQYLKQARGFDFTGYKRSTLKRRVVKQMQSRQIATFGDYLDYLEVHPDEFELLFNTILINVTSFFRDPETWQYFQQQVLPAILSDLASDAPIRCWTAGCASGQETYTLAMILAELLGVEAFRQRVKIYATDVDEEALAQSRSATYDSREIESVPPELREQYFDRQGNAYVFRSDLRRSVIFGRHDLLQDAPISRLDILICRNVLMYFNTEAQSRIVARFHFALRDSGILFLGKAEMMLSYANLFAPISLPHRVFSQVAKLDLRDRLLVLAQAGDAEASNRLSNSIQLREATFNSSPIAQLVVDCMGILILANHQARSLFGINLQDIGRPFQDLEVSYRPLELRSLVEQVYDMHQSLIMSNVERKLPSQTQYLDIHVSPLYENGNTIIGVSISFVDVTRSIQLRDQLHRVSQELETANEELQSSNEELETTNEELQSTNEELETTNEELQSTNEELETMNEELQSTNEELQTINDELQQRTVDLNHANGFLSSILSSLRTGVVVVDRQFNIISWSNEAENLWGIRADEVQQQSLFCIDIGLAVEQLREPIRRCLNGQTDHQEIMLEAINRRGRKIQCRIGFSPLMGLDQERRGVILLMDSLDLPT